MVLVKDAQKLAIKLAEYYRLPYVRIAPAEVGYRNQSFKIKLEDGNLVNLMIFKAEPAILEKITRADQAADLLAAQGLPVRVRVKKKLVKLSASSWQHSGYAGLYNYLPGHTISWEAYNKNHIKLLGWAMGMMHKAWRENALSPPQAESDSIYPLLQDLLARMEAYFNRAEVKVALKAKLGLQIGTDFRQYQQAILAGQKLKLQHYLHMDFVRSNILFSDNEELTLTLEGNSISGIIDFEKAAWGSPLFDLARTLAFLMVDCKYKTPTKTHKYFLYSGYEKRGNSRIPRAQLLLGGTSHLLLDQYVQLFLLHDFYKFLRHNPYEFLNQNQHFLRTRSILESFGMLK